MRVFGKLSRCDIVVPGAKRPKKPPVAVGRWVSARIFGPADFGLRV